MTEKTDSKILFVEPEFPIAAKSKNHSNFLPIGLLKLASYYRNLGYQIQLHRGNYLSTFYPDKIMVTSLFTYWAGYVKDTVYFYKKAYPNADIIVGGIYATLMPEHCKEYTRCDSVFIGQHNLAEQSYPAYDLINVNYQIIHGMRGCTRTCSFCGIWRLEKKGFKNALQIQEEVKTNKIVFYDNNLLANPDIENILTMLSHLRFNNKVIHCESQSGVDGRILEEKPHLADMLKKARFSNIRVAWDFGYEQHKRVENWINILKSAGYNHRSIFVFMIYNWDFDFEQMELKRQKCFDWNTQIADCRYRPLVATHDYYNVNIPNQTSQDYFIHQNWTDSYVKLFRKNVRQHNICIRYKIPWSKYSRQLETEYARNKIIGLGA
jgi:radical SAM superfamily enzyme YgiQ (UPF0313 family)